MRIVLEANIGVGKSSLLHFLKSTIPNIEVATEPVELWKNIGGTNMLEMFNKDMKKYALTFQHTVMTSLLERDVALKNCPHPIIFERSIDSVKNVFAKVLEKNGCIDSDDVNILNYCHGVYKKLVKPIDLIVYLKASPETALTRIKKRGRKEEDEINLAYLEDLNKFYQEYIVESETNVVILETEQSEESLRAESKKIIEYILKMKNVEK